jgi:hypothetical protein
VHQVGYLTEINTGCTVNKTLNFYRFYKALFFFSCGAATFTFLRFLDHAKWRTTVGRTPLDEWWVCRRDLYLTTHKTHKRQTTMPRGGTRTHNPNKLAAAEPRLRPRGNRDRLQITYCRPIDLLSFRISLQHTPNQLCISLRSSVIQKSSVCIGVIIAFYVFY